MSFSSTLLVELLLCQTNILSSKPTLNASSLSRYHNTLDLYPGTLPKLLCACPPQHPGPEPLSSNRTIPLNRICQKANEVNLLRIKLQINLMGQKHDLIEAIFKTAFIKLIWGWVDACVHGRLHCLIISSSGWFASWISIFKVLRSSVGRTLSHFAESCISWIYMIILFFIEHFETFLHWIIINICWIIEMMY